MKVLLVTIAIFFIASQAKSYNSFNQEDNHDHARMITPEEDNDTYFNEMMFNLFGVKMNKARYRFSQTTWRECSDEITGNFSGYNCSNRRRISVILKTFIDRYAYNCIDQGLKAQGISGQVDELHITHNGITGDRNHSPRSMHAENRAVDVKAFSVKLRSGKEYKFSFAYSKNRPFYRAYRKCWGRTVNKHNNCPFYKGQSVLTGSIGWENRRHQHHMHMSVPYCVRGKYAGNYYRR